MARKRARTNEGHFVADDPSTPDVNEAYVSEEAPKPDASPDASKKAKQRKALKADTPEFTMFVSSSPESSVYDLRIGDNKIMGVWDGVREHVSWRVPAALTEAVMQHHFVWSGRIINAEED